MEIVFISVHIVRLLRTYTTLHMHHIMSVNARAEVDDPQPHRTWSVESGVIA